LVSKVVGICGYGNELQFLDSLANRQERSQDGNSRHGQTIGNTVPCLSGERFLVDGNNDPLMLGCSIQNELICRMSQPNILNAHQIHGWIPPAQPVYDVAMHVFIAQESQHGRHFPYAWRRQVESSKEPSGRH
jgi:hypothetical protein